MNSTLKRIAFPLILIVLLPAVAFSVFELTSLNETEKVIEEIYVNQLDVILNSVNQYSDLAVTSWTSNVGTALKDLNFDLTKLTGTDIAQLLEANPSITQIILTDNLQLKERNIIENKNGSGIDVLKEIINLNEDKIKRLYDYAAKGYNKIEPLTSLEGGNQFLATILSGENRNVIVFFELDPSLFIEQVLRQPILEAAGEEFAIACFSEDDVHQFNFDEAFNTDNFNATSNLWLLPDYQMGIVLKGRTLGGLIAQRTYTNLILLLLLTIVIITGVVIVYRNIRKELELAQIKSDFVSNVSHELRTPLALISMYAETLEMGRVKSDEKKEEYYRIMSNESNRLGKIVNSILSFSKIEAGKRKYNFTPTNINELIKNVYETYNYHLASKGFRFEIDLGDKIPQINIDGEAVSEALINLIDNAAKYSKNDKIVYLSTGIKNNRVFVEVQDKGIGIPKADQKKIFDKFFRVSTGLVHDTKGTGLGLTIVKHVMDAHNAIIEIESEIDKGSTFRVLFPVDKSR